MQQPQDNSKVERGMQDINQAFKERDVQAKAKELKLPYVNLMRLPVNPDLAMVLSREDAEKARAALFFKSGKELRLGVLDPQAPETQALIEKLKTDGFQVSLSLCSEESLAAGQRVYFTQRYQAKEKIENTVQEKDLGSFEKEVQNLEALKDKIEASDFDQALNFVQVGGYKTRASDVHFQPEEAHVIVRFRIDGVLVPIFNLSRKIYEGILKQIKQLSHLKLNVSTVPQDGQYSFIVNQKQINVRVSILPSHYGEACVMRLLDREENAVSIEALGYEGEALKHLQEASRLSHGLILVTGPTGSGKTTTLYALLQAIDSNHKKIITLEDPVEYNLSGVTQSQVNLELGYTFNTGIRAILRQDPDVIMVGEIRDIETAETAAQASLTGHLVISTLHTNSAIESIPRLVNMGLKHFILAPALDLIIAQRLVRRVCSCAQNRPLTAVEKEHVDFTLQAIQKKGIAAPVTPGTFKQPVGCDACSKTGYKGQLAIAEVLRFNQELRDLILEEKPMSEIYRYIEAHCKMLSLHEDGILKVIKGLTTLDEVYRVAA